MESNPRLQLAKLLIRWGMEARHGPRRSRMAWPEQRNCN